MTNNTINNVPCELLETLIEQHITAHGFTNHTARQAQLILCAPSPAGVDGLEVYITDCATCVDVVPAKTVTDAKVVLAKDAQAIIDGLRGETEVMTQHANNYSRMFEECAEELDQHAQRIGELEGLLRSCLPALSDGGCAALANRIDSALSAGKEGE